jgi:hypothetical protein
MNIMTQEKTQAPVQHQAMVNYNVAIHVNDKVILIQESTVLAKSGCSVVC